MTDEMIDDLVLEEQILDFLAALHDPLYELELFFEICVYGAELFPNVDMFKSWWTLKNISLRGSSPLQMADTVAGRNKILDHLKKMLDLQGDRFISPNSL